MALSKDQQTEILNDRIDTDVHDEPFAFLEIDGLLRVMGRGFKGEERSKPFFFDRLYEKNCTGYILQAEKIHFHPDCITDAILLPANIYKMVYFGDWKKQLDDASDYFAKYDTFEKMDVKKLR